MLYEVESEGVKGEIVDPFRDPLDLLVTPFPKVLVLEFPVIEEPPWICGTTGYRCVFYLNMTFFTQLYMEAPGFLLNPSL